MHVTDKNLTGFVNYETISEFLTKIKWYGDNFKTFNYGSDWTVFYVIGNWEEDKIAIIIENYCKSFTNKDKVKLIVKTKIDQTNKHLTLTRVENILNNYSEYPELLLVVDDTLDDCFVNSFGKYKVDSHSDFTQFNRITKVDDSIVIFSDGVFFKEQIDEDTFGRFCLSKSKLKFNKSKYSSIKLTLLYNVGDFNKTIEILIDSSIKKSVQLIRNIRLELIIPITGISTLEFLVKGVKNTSSSLYESNKLVGFYVLNPVLMGNSESTLVDLNCVVNEEQDLKHILPSKSYSPISPFDIIKGNYDIKMQGVSTLDIKNTSEFKGIHYIGQYGTSGYASAAKGNLYYFFKNKVPITWTPLYFDNSVLNKDDEYNIIVESLIKKDIKEIDTVILHSTPDIWKECRTKNQKLFEDKRVIGYTVWESSKLPLYWVECINDFVDEVWCPSEYNRTVFRNSGVTIPIKVFPHVFLPRTLPEKDSVNIRSYKKGLVNHNKYTFYNISELNPRKGVEDLVKTFCDTFTETDEVQLILKTHYKNYDLNNKRYCYDKLSNIVSGYSNPPSIFYILDNLSDEEILGLHAIGNCYVSLCRSEGFGLTIFDAYKYGKDVITTGYSGHIDFLGKNYKGLVNYKIAKIGDEMKSFSTMYDGDQEWAVPDLKHTGELMWGLYKINRECPMG